MTSRIKIYSIILGVIYTITVIFSLSTFIESFKAGLKEGYNEKTSSTRTLHVNTVPKAGLYSFPEQIINTISGESMLAESDNYKIRMNFNNIQVPTYLVVFEFIVLILAIIFLFAIISLPIIFFKVIKDASKGQIMKPKVIKNIRYLGITISSIYIFEVLTSLIDYLKSINIVGFENYNIVFNLPDSGLLFLGIVTLLMAEILKVSNKLKEEQDLTI